MTDNPLPKTVNEAIEYLLSRLDDENRDKLKSMPKHVLWTLHRGYGQGVRNALGLWGTNKELLSDPELAGMDPDSMSELLIKRLWEKLNSEQDD